MLQSIAKGLGPPRWGLLLVWYPQTQGGAVLSPAPDIGPARWAEGRGLVRPSEPKLSWQEKPLTVAKSHSPSLAEAGAIPAART